ncbi:MAG: hypothetical protein K2P88_15270 [Chitinophagaceae bacterium]|uniref:hypothetical protein n=1 Tax=unclassified Paraflavitalea TaxID=2798305 RepID=UPI003D341AE1|nr:hypothetical protein [Chitinophagaceae bacterium]
MKKLLALAIIALGFSSCSKTGSTLTPVNDNQPSVNKEVAPTPPPPCTNIYQLDLKQGKREAIPTIWSIKVAYGIKACDNTQTLSGTLEVYNNTTGELVMSSSNLPLSGQTTFLGVAFGIYRVVLKAVNAETGAVIETKVASIKVAWPGV